MAFVFEPLPTLVKPAIVPRDAKLSAKGRAVLFTRRIAIGLEIARDHGLAELQALEAAVGEFFDRAVYYLVRGYEMQAATPPRSAR